jgi:hypothetical protein
MRNSTPLVRGATMCALVAIGATASGDATAAAVCSDGVTADNYAPEPLNNGLVDYPHENPSGYNVCVVFPNGGNGDIVLGTGPGAVTLFQDQSSAMGSTYAVAATSINNVAVYGYSEGSSSSAGVEGVNDTGGYGAWGYNTSNGDGVHGDSTSGIGVHGDGGTYGVFGYSSGGDAVFGSSSSGYGVDGFSTSNYGVYGSSTDEGGVRGDSANDYSGTAGINTSVSGNCSGAAGCSGVYGLSTNGAGVYGESTNSYAGYFLGKVNVTGEIYVGSCSGCTSDVRLKKNVEPLTGALDRLLKLKGVTFEWKDASAHQQEAGHGVGTQTGFVAQDVESVFPNWVKQDGYTGPDGEKYKTLELRQIEALEVESIRTLKIQNDEFRERLKALEAGRRPMMSGFGEGWIGAGLLGLAAAVAFTRRKQSAAGS